MSLVLSHGFAAMFSWIVLIALVELIDGSFLNITVKDTNQTVDDYKLGIFAVILVAVFFFLVGSLYGWMVT